MQRLERAWQEVPLVWLAGVRRVCETLLAKDFGDSEFLNCDLPGEVWRLEDPEAFFKSVRKPLVVLDEVHEGGRGLDPDRFGLKPDAWTDFDPAFFHLSTTALQV
jgi:hypothetical protein